MLKVITAPIEEPVSLPEAKGHLRVDFADDDVYIDALISAARHYAEGFQRRSLAEQTLELILDGFTTELALLQPPVVSVSSIKYKDSGGTEITIPSSDYIVGTERAVIIPATGKSWPTDIYPLEAVKIQYAAGYTPATIPLRTKQALLLIIGHWYENRETVIIGKTAAEVPLAAMSLLWMDRAW